MEVISERPIHHDTTVNVRTGSGSAVSWPAILAGAAGAAAISLVMFILGIGLGLTSVSPWSGRDGISAETFGISAILWITLTSLVASALGGYLTGRLRTRWVAVHTDEVYFRDTAHGFLAWGVATLLTATLFTSVSAQLAGTAARAGAAVAGGVADTVATTTTAAAGAGTAAIAGGGNEDEGPLSYYLDSLFRRDAGALNARTINTNAVAPAQPPTPQQQAQGGNDATTAEGAEGLSPEQQGNAAAGGAGAESMLVPQTTLSQGQQSAQPPSMPEVTRIFMRGIREEGLAPEDRSYVAGIIARYANVTPQEAERRVDETFERVRTELNELETSARQAADEARAASAKVMLWFFVSLLAGAFIGSFSATIGGRQRDN